MGYTTKFEGSFRLDKALDAETRRKIEQLHDRRHDDYEWLGLPGIWCQWRVGDDGQSLEWDRGEKFYDYVEWLAYIVKYILMPAGYELSGTVAYQGERVKDGGRIAVMQNKIQVIRNWLVMP